MKMKSVHCVTDRLECLGIDLTANVSGKNFDNVGSGRETQGAGIPVPCRGSRIDASQRVDGGRGRPPPEAVLVGAGITAGGCSSYGDSGSDRLRAGQTRGQGYTSGR